MAPSPELWSGPVLASQRGREGDRMRLRAVRPSARGGEGTLDHSESL
jgi:hypothetical protein